MEFVFCKPVVEYSVLQTKFSVMHLLESTSKHCFPKCTNMALCYMDYNIIALNIYFALVVI